MEHIASTPQFIIAGVSVLGFVGAIGGGVCWFLKVILDRRYVTQQDLFSAVKRMDEVLMDHIKDEREWRKVHDIDHQKTEVQLRRILCRMEELIASHDVV
ncbi:hypothetical protein CCP2SC5_1040015 [Azospirillaceae bacterium]